MSQNTDFEKQQLSVQYTFMQEYQQLKEENINLRIKLSNIMGQYEQLQTILHGKNETENDLKKHLDSLEKNNIFLNQENLQIKEEIIQLRLDNIYLMQRNTQLEADIAYLKQRNIVLEIDIADLKQKNNELEIEKQKTKIYQKIADNFSRINSAMFNIFCDSDSEIFKKSKDNSLNCLVDHLTEYETKKYERYSKVSKNIGLWENIYNSVKQILLEEFSINNIAVFYEIVKLRKHRNSMSHSSEEITLDELKSVSNYGEELWECLNKNDEEQ